MVSVWSVVVATWSICGQYVVGKPDQYLLLLVHNRPCHGFRPPFCWVGKEIKEKLPSPIQILLESARGAESTVRFRRFLQFYVSKRYRSLEPIELSVFSSRLVNISSIRWKSGQVLTPGKNPSHTPQYVTNACRLQNARPRLISIASLRLVRANAVTFSRPG